MGESFMLTLFLVSLVSLCVGSFISAITYRIPRGLGFIKGRSFCDSCKKSIKWFENIPLFSYLYYKGKSRCCDKKISIRYPLIELASLIGSIAIYLNGSNLLLAFLLFYLTLTIFVIDFEHQIIPDSLNWTILLVGVLFTIDTLTISLLFGLIASLFLLFIHLVTRGRGMGLGDVKLAFVLGLWFNPISLFSWLILSFLTGGVVASILLVMGLAKYKTRIAFGPFLVIGFWLVYIFNVTVL